MGFLGGILKTAVNVVLTPVDIIADTVTCGGAFTGQKEPYTVQRVKKVVEAVEEAGEDAADGDFF